MDSSIRPLLEDAYVLHRRSFRETSMLVDVFIRHHGLIRLMAKGVKRGKAPLASILQPFLHLKVSWVGRSQLPVMTSGELVGRHALSGRAMFCGLYLNELLVRLLPAWDAYPQLFTKYRNTLEQLSADGGAETTLRYFELQLLDELGYGPVLDVDTETGEQVLPDRHYEYINEHGLIPCDEHRGSYQGATLLGLSHRNLETPLQLREGKRLMRDIINHALGNRPLHSRALFRYTRFE